MYAAVYRLGSQRQFTAFFFCCLLVMAQRRFLNLFDDTVDAQHISSTAITANNPHIQKYDVLQRQP